MTVYPTVDEIVFAHNDVVAKFGGSQGVRDEKLLESAVYRCQVSYGGEDLYGTIFEKAAAIFHAILFDHPFIDGNKRTALSAAVILLENNGWIFLATHSEAVAFPLAVEKSRPEIEDITKWFKDHFKKRVRRKK